MTAPTWATPLSFDGLALNLTELDVMLDLDPDWIGWATGAVVTDTTRDVAEKVSR